jgi:hypothetical protein
MMDNCSILDDGIASTKADLSRMESSPAFFVKGLKEESFKDLAELADEGDRLKVVCITPLLEIFA